MNALMRVQISVVNRTARELANVRSDAAKTEASLLRMQAAASKNVGFLDRRNLEKYGKNLQWTGRQIEYNFTLPLVLAGAAATKFALANEKAFTRLTKVYGDVGASTDAFAGDLALLRRGFRALSDTFGVAQSEVIEIGAAWAAAGAQGYGLAKATRATMEAMILGDLAAAEATQSLIAIQAQYKLNSTELTAVLAQLNAVENQTAVDMGGLVQAFSRVAGTAYTAGIEARELAALIASITPAAGTAAQAGNSLRTIISRLMAPTGDAADLMERMGINLGGVWKQMDGTERIVHMAQKFEQLDDAQRAVVSAFVASRYQINRFDTLMRAVLDPTSGFARALEATEGGVAANSKVMQQYNKEIGIFLSSSPQGFKIMTTQLQNLMAEIIVPLLPAIMAVLQRVVALVRSFTDLSPGMQQLIIVALLVVAAFGTMNRLIGAGILLYGRLAATAIFLGRALGITRREMVIFNAVTQTEDLLLYRRGLFHVAGALLMLPFRTVGRAAEMMWAGMVIGAKTVLPAVTILFKGMALASLVSMKWLVARVSTAWSGLVVAAQGVGSALVGVWRAVSAAAVTSWAVFRFLVGAIWASMAGLAASTGAIITASWWAVSNGSVTAWQGFRSATILIWRSMVAAARSIGFAWQIALATPTVLAKGLKMAGTGFTAFYRMIVAGGFKAGALLKVAMSSWQAWVILAVVALAVVFRRQLGQAVDWVVKKFQQLLPGVIGTLTAVVTVIKTAAKRAFEWLSYLNPFAKHSPSLVEQVNAGVALISKAYGSLANIGVHFRRAVDDLNAFKHATANAHEQFANMEFAEMRGEAITLDPSVGPSFDTLWASIKRLEGDLFLVGREFAAQELIVLAWKDQLDAANASLKIASDRLDELQAVASRARDELDAAKQVLDTLTSTPITGMRAMSDAIFSNEMAQKQLRLEMLRMEEINGPLKDIESRLARLAGEVEGLTATQEELRQAGAGSDVLSFYDDQIAAIEATARAMEGQAAPMREMEKEMERLQRTGEMLDLENSLKFDPLLRQIEQVTDSMAEMPFDQLMAQIKGQQNEVTRLTAVWDQADAAVRQQQQVVDDLTVTRDALQASYEAEKESLDALGVAYDAIEAQIRAMEQAMQDFVSAQARASKGRTSPALDAFEDAAGGNFDEPSLGLPPETGDLEALVKQCEEDSKKLFGGMDMFAPIKEMWQKAWGWIKENVGPVVGPVFDTIITWMEPGLQKIKEMWDEEGGLGGIIKTAGTGIADFLTNGPMKPATEAVSGAFTALKDSIQTIWEWIGPSVKAFVELVVHFFKNLVKQVGDELQNWLPLIKEIFSAIGVIIDGLVTVFKVSLGIILAVWQVVWPVLLNVLRPILDFIVEAIRAALQIIRGVITMILAIINGDWERFWDGMKTFLNGIWDAIYAILRGVVGVMVGLVLGIVGAVANVWDGLKKVMADPVNWVIDNVLNKFLEVLENVAKAMNFKLDLPRVPRMDDGSKSGGGGGGAPRVMHTGGLVDRWGSGREIPAVLQAGEGVLPISVMKKLGPDGFARLMGGEIGGPVDWVKSIPVALLAGARDIVSTVAKPAIEGGLRMLGDMDRFGVPGKVVAAATRKVGEVTLNWLSNIDNEASNRVGKLPPGSGYQRLVDYMRNSGVRHRVTSTMRAGDPGLHGAGRAADFAGPVPSSDSPALLAIYKAFEPVVGQLSELIYAGPGATSYKDGRPYPYSQSVRDNHHDHVHAALYNGGIIPGSRQGTLIRAGERGQSEAVVPLPNGWRDDIGKKEIHFHGDLSFPNVKNGGDAEAFLRNLETLAS